MDVTGRKFKCKKDVMDDDENIIFKKGEIYDEVLIYSEKHIKASNSLRWRVDDVITKFFFTPISEDA